MSDAERPPTMRTGRCILWRPRASKPDRELLGALARRSLAVADCEEAFAAMGALCRERALPGPLILLLSDPRRLDGAADVVGAARRYVPQAVVWVFDSAARRLAALAPSDLAERRPAAIAATAARAEPKVATARAALIGSPKLKLAGEGELPPAEDTPAGSALSAGSAAPHPSRQVLTDEELAMLLSPGPIRGNG